MRIKTAAIAGAVSGLLCALVFADVFEAGSAVYQGLTIPGLKLRGELKAKYNDSPVVIRKYEADESPEKVISAAKIKNSFNKEANMRIKSLGYLFHLCASGSVPGEFDAAYEETGKGRMRLVTAAGKDEKTEVFEICAEIPGPPGRQINGEQIRHYPGASKKAVVDISGKEGGPVSAAVYEVKNTEKNALYGYYYNALEEGGWNILAGHGKSGFLMAEKNGRNYFIQVKTGGKSGLIYIQG